MKKLNCLTIGKAIPGNAKSHKIIFIRILITGLLLFSFFLKGLSQETRLLRQPTISDTQIAFCYGGDIWISNLNDSSASRLTSTPAVESDPHFSPDGKWIAFTSNRSGNNAIYIVSSEGGDAKRLTWHPSGTNARGWTLDGKRVLFASTRNTPPSSFDRLWTVSVEGGPPELLSSQWATNGSFSPDGNRIIIDRVRRWDVEWRAYRGGQNTPLIILNLNDKSEILLPNESTTDIQPVWMGDKIYFLSDRDYTTNIWSYSPASGQVKQVTNFSEKDVKWLSSNSQILAFERDGYLHTMNPVDGEINRLSISVRGDFPWAGSGWEDVSKNISSVSISPTGKRVIMEARGEIFTTPVKYGDSRNITRSSGAADRSPVWSPKRDKIAWFSDIGGKGYSLMITGQDGLSEPRSISIGESKMAWESVWSGDGKYIAFTDDDVRVRIVDIDSEEIYTIDTGGTNLERGSMGLIWSHDSKWLAYSKGGTNNFRRIMIWSVEGKTVKPVTNEFADSYSPAWDMDNSHLYFLASTDLALGSGWANTSSMTADPVYSPYIINLKKDDPSPFKLRSDEESAEAEKETGSEKEKENKKEKKKEKSSVKEEQDTKKKEQVTIDFENIERRTIPLPVPRRNYSLIKNGPAGIVFLGEQKENVSGVVLQKFTLKEREAKEFISGARQVSVSADGNKILARVNGNWKVMTASKPNGKDGESIRIDLKIKVNRPEEWSQIFEEAWRYERDYFYDKNMHGRDWNEVYNRYAPLVPYIKHRTDLTYILDQVNGELSVGHSFVGGGDYPDVERSSTGLLGADLVPENKYWKISRIYTTESWNPGLSSPLDRPGINVHEGNYLVGIDGKEITDADNIFQYLDGTAGRQIIIHINKEPEFEGSWKETIEPIRSENALRQRAWVEDNRRLVDKLSGGRLAYIWVPNTGGPGFVSFNRYFFAQQDKEGAVIDERFNGGGLLDDYMVDLMTRKLRASLTNEVPDGRPMQLPAGILGPMVLLINELAGSGG
ncbi:MAG TPA: protease, partial [Bacteroidales bacterium]|nr:protease [Bacteroidales bacterium]